MSLTNRISVIIDVTTEKGVKALTSFKSAVKDAEGFTGKLKAGIGSLGTTFGAAAKNPAVMATAVTAVGTAVLAAADQFSDLGVEVGKFSDATGMATEDASRWIEVAGDIGIAAGTLEGTVGKMAKALGQAPQQFAALGVEVVHTASGAVDMNATLLRAIDVINGISDPTKKAAVATKLLGRGWQEVAELVGKGSTEIAASLADVADVKVFSADEVKKAREYRDAMNELTDKFGELALEVGQNVLPVLTKAADAIILITDVANQLSDTKALPSTTKAFQDLVPRIEAAGLSVRDLAEDFDLGRKSIDDIKKELPVLTALTSSMAGESARAGMVLNELAGEYRDAASAAKAQREAVEALAQAERDLYAEQMSRVDAERALERQTDDTEESIADYNATVEEYGAASEEASDATRNAADDMIDLAKAQAEAATGSTTSKEAIDSQIISLAVMQSTLEPGSPLWLAIDAHIKHLEAVPTEVSTKMSVTGDTLTIKGKRAKGGPVSTGGAYLVGEEGPEIVSLPGGSYVTPNDQIAGGVGRSAGGSPVTINVYPRTMPSASELSEWIRSARRRGEII